MEAQLDALKGEFQKDLEQIRTPQELDELKVRYLGRKGALTGILRQMSSLSAEERPRIGALSNTLKNFMEQQIGVKALDLSHTEDHHLDITLPGRVPRQGTVHILNQVLFEIEEIFVHLGFTIASGPEVEDDYHNFEALNIPAHHPARDMQDTFYFTEDILLRTHTSPVQIRVMESKDLPVRIIAPGKVYRCDADITHSPMFHQVEGLWVEEGITFAHLKGVLYAFIHELFGSELPLRFRPSFFPFTEPSAEVDMGCFSCRGKGCRLCKNTGWIEILGSGMVDPAVYGYVGVDTERATGFAFGVGVERVAMLRYGITDIRDFYENDLRFLRQFTGR